MIRDIRAALIGGLAATFVVVVSLAPKLASHTDEVTVRNSSSHAAPAMEDTTTSTVPAEATTTTVAATPTTSAPAPAEPRVTKVEERVTVLEKRVTTTTTPAEPEVAFYYEGSVALGPEAETEPSDGTWKVGFRATVHKPGLRVRFLARTKTGPSEFVAAFSDPRPMYKHSAIARIDAASLDLPANPARQSGSHVVFDRIVALEWDGGSKTL